MKGKYSRCGSCTMERLVRNLSFVALSLPRAGGPGPEEGVPQTQARSDLEECVKSGRSSLQPYSEQLIILSCSTKRQLGECQRERDFICTGVRWNRLWPVRDFWLFGEVVCAQKAGQ